ncbi:hypothetical protein [Pontibacter akesuensis]|uniref:Lipocalin-like domain-containing protein n=1 Tax=Pontibacter akesuensis TaxID=388950 RepID=A0A1I7KW31_9BACT|nr:hypothetical protein [Pontibacter akesuensis]GHA80381.1 hypothetical protein GCM10007389_38240 [Pontibacter akesuensis]SFV01578.1 hypothetical protein SAMN04487941_0007 [Pontibacter akesuensis]
MKKLLLFLLPVLFLVSCGDDEKVEPEPKIPEGEISQDLQGKWHNYLVKREYYGDADTVMYADSVNIQTYFEFKGDQMLITTPGSSTPEAWTYSLPDKDDPNRIVLTRGSASTDYMVVSITDTEMVWLDEEAYAGYPMNVPDSEKKTSKVGKYTYRFRRQ